LEVDEIGNPSIQSVIAVQRQRNTIPGTTSVLNRFPIFLFLHNHRICFNNTRNKPLIISATKPETRQERPMCMVELAPQSMHQ
jgi:hypothetical protein